MNDIKAQPAGSPPDLAALQSRVNRIQQSIVSHQQRLARGTQMTVSIGGILCIAIVAWFTIGYIKLDEFLEPNVLANYATSMIMDRMPEQRRKLEQQVTEEAPRWAATASKELQDRIPGLRGQAEDFLLEKVEEAFGQLQVLTAQQFRTFVSNNQPMLADGFRSLKKPEEAERFVADLHSAIEGQMSGNMREQAEDMLHIVIDLNAKLEQLQKGEKLNSEQALEREILMVAKRLQHESALEQEPTFGTTSSPAAKKKTRSRPAEAGPEAAADQPEAKPADDAEKPKAESKAGEGENKAADSEKPAKEESKKETKD